MSGFNFGGTGAPTGGFTFGSTKTATTTPATGFSFSTPGTGGFNFGAPSQPVTSTPSTSLFTLTTPAPASQTPGFSLGGATPASGGAGFSLGINTPKLNLGNPAAPQATVNPSAFGLGTSTLTSAVPSAVTSSQAVAPGGFVFGSSTTSTPAPTTSGGFSLTGGSTAQASTSSFNVGSVGSLAQPTALAGLPFASATPAAPAAGATQPAAPAPTAASTSTGPSLFASIATAPASSAAPSLSLCPPATSAAAPGAGTLGFSLKPPGTASSTSAVTSTTAATTTTAFALNLKPLAPAGLPSNVPTTGPGLSGPSAATGAPGSPALTYAQLESLINKWSLELEDQERHFLQQATQVNAWDRTLIENGEKITSLHREVEKVKLDQKRLDQELDFILSQQKELEDLLSPLEEAAKEQSGTIYLQHADEEREKTYKLAENIDAQLKRMAQDLKDIIEHLNTAGGPADSSDPLQQICKILNAHMDSLQWVDQNSALLQRRVEEASKVCEGRRKEQERSFRITFD
ncbi:nuclear pore glycoprotein p62 [Orycteropus afer afer]|uniref:Nuclear pore glycoprotein p62 n=1 Tax=Orycteropus afer afer TaxID=1230840 RepID=A0A8B6ZZE0_ORYAF|nr:nuclear pore glycoprotein p62 [Orycteropus afer afer]